MRYDVILEAYARVSASIGVEAESKEAAELLAEKLANAHPFDSAWVVDSIEGIIDAVLVEVK